MYLRSFNSEIQIRHLNERNYIMKTKRKTFIYSEEKQNNVIEIFLRDGFDAIVFIKGSNLHRLLLGGLKPPKRLIKVKKVHNLLLYRFDR